MELIAVLESLDWIKNLLNGIKITTILIQNMLLMVLMNGCINGIKIIFIYQQQKKN